ncbi:hypothetical protein [Acinetobacter sp. SwsAc4]|uniref:hypothetical protein n=1 Tax=Acinetobacter sp. SwsAc4 TaxID=2749437 RepID=UPI0015B87B10|nr:hypothetical protein [Acinetobacter sp. SwsAc4]NWK82233.1 hypothetical protein [Acinetobacter sp. SwsAc4]
MKIKTLMILGFSTILTACNTPYHKFKPVVEIAPVSPPSPVSNSIEVIEIEEKSINKSFSNGSHLINLPMTRDFILGNGPTLELEKGGNPKINAIKPNGDTKPRAVILFNNKLTWNNILVRKKNLELCKGFMKLPSVEIIVENGSKTGYKNKKDNKNNVITYMPTTIANISNLPKTSEDCSTFLTAGYDYNSSVDELNFILSQQNINRGNVGNSASGLEITRTQNKSPYIVVYESPQSPYSSMILGLGQASPESIVVLAKNWPELLAKVYRHGDNLDPVVGVVMMLNNDPVLKEAQKEAMWKNISIVATGAVCGGAISAGTPISLATLFVTPACKKFYEDAKEHLGYS